MNIYCYFHPLDSLDHHEEMAMIKLWEDRWRSAGFVPVVLGMKDCLDHPFFDQYIKQVGNYPSSNLDGYDLHCWLRWIAMANLKEDGILLMSDYDVFSLHPPLFFGDLMTGHSLGVPCLVSGKRQHFEAMTRHFVDDTMTWNNHYIQINGVTHFSDMLAFGLSNLPFLKLENGCRRIDETDAMSGWAIHFSHAAIHKMGYTNKLEAVKEILLEANWFPLPPTPL